MFYFFGHAECRAFTLWPGIKPVPPALEAKSQPLGPQRSPWQKFISNVFNEFLNQVGKKYFL